MAEKNMDEFAITPAAEAIFSLILAAKRLGIQPHPTAEDPMKIVTEIDIVKDMPRRMFDLAKAIEALNASNNREIEQILDGAMTILRLKIAIHAILGWIASRGLPTGEPAQMVIHAVQGPTQPSGSLLKMYQAKEKLVAAMGEAATSFPSPSSPV
jgi:hypothetical protein